MGRTNRYYPGDDVANETDDQTDDEEWFSTVDIGEAAGNKQAASS